MTVMACCEAVSRCGGDGMMGCIMYDSVGWAEDHEWCVEAK